MKTFYVKVKYSHIELQEVEAEDEEAAKEMIISGEGMVVDDSYDDVFDEILEVTEKGSK